MRRVELVGVDVEAHAVALDDEVVHAGQRVEPVGGPASSASIDVRVRWRSSASVPVSTRAAGADDADPVAQRLDLGQDVAGQQHRAALVACSSMHSLNTASISGSRPEVGSSSISSSTSEASAATRATFCRLPLE